MFNLPDIPAPPPENRNKELNTKQTTMIDLPEIPAPPPKNRNKELNLFVDCESFEGPDADFGGPASIGMAGRCGVTRQPIFDLNWVFTPLANRVSKKQIQGFWLLPENIQVYEQLMASAIPRIEAADGIRELISRVKAAGWKIVVYARPLAYDFRLITELFTTIGVEHAHQRFEVNGETGTATQILNQVMSAWDMSKGGMPAHYDDRNNNASPFGFGGISQGIDMAQIMVGYLWGLDLRGEIYFNDVMKKVLGRGLTHNSLQDAQDQAAVWYHFLDLKEAVSAARLTGDQRAIEESISNVAEFFRPLPRE